MKCRHCGKEIVKFCEAGPWVHAENCAVECCEPTSAEPEKTDG